VTLTILDSWKTNIFSNGIITGGNQSYNFFRRLTKGFHRAQVKTLTAITTCITLAGRLRSFDVAQILARKTNIQNKSALQRFYRFINNKKFDDLKLWEQLSFQLLSAAGDLPRVSIDWTEWHSDLRILAASVAVDRRAIPLYAQTFHKSNMPRSQNSRENTFVRLINSHFSPHQKKRFVI
jgi:hypothetical protein